MADLNKMNERERAAYYQAHRDSGELEEVASPVTKGKRPRLSASITVRFSPEEAEIIRAAARAGEGSYSDVVRAAVRQLAAPRYHVHSFHSVALKENVRTGTCFAGSYTGNTSSGIPETGRLGAARTRIA